jgi:hypothetical protein
MGEVSSERFVVAAPDRVGEVRVADQLCRGSPSGIEGRGIDGGGKPGAKSGEKGPGEALDAAIGGEVAGGSVDFHGKKGAGRASHPVRPPRRFRSAGAVAAAFAAGGAAFFATSLLAAVAAAGLFGAAALATGGDTGAEGEHGDAGGGDEEQVSQGIHGSFVFLLWWVCQAKDRTAQGSLARYFVGFFSNLATQGLQQNLISCPS